MRSPALISSLLLLPWLVLACKPEPAATAEPADTPTATPAEAPEVPADPRHYWVGSLALPNNQSLDWAIAIEPPADDPEAAPVAQLWIPTQLIMRYPVGSPVIADDGSIVVHFAPVDATWTIQPGDSPGCSFSQQGVEIDCDLEAVEAQEFAELMTPARPQTPKSPFPYTVEEVEIPNPAAPGVTLAGSLTLPPGPGPHPAVVLITGSGLQDRDETIVEHKPFWVIADHLSRHGVAVLRYDDRGYAKSTGDGTTATLVDFASDSYAVAHWLAARPEVDPDRLGLIGHSEGGVIAPLVASEHPDEIDFLVLLAGTGVSGSAIVVHQLGLIMAAGGASPEAIEREQASARALHRVVLESPPGEAKAAVEAELRASFAALPEAERPSPAEIDAAIAAQSKMLTSPWFVHFLAYDPVPALKKVKVPILVLAGDKDLQVDPNQNLAPIKQALKRNKAVDIVRFPGLNHLFQTATTGAPSEYGVIEQTLAPEVLDRITTWIGAL